MPSYVQPEFPVEEYQARVKRACQMMDELHFDALMLTGDLSAAPNYRYLSGHLPRDYQSNFSRPHILLLRRDGEAKLIVYVLTERDAQKASWVRDVRSYTQPFKHEIVLDAIKELGLSKSTIGVELGLDMRLMMPVQEFLSLRDALPDSRFVDASGLLWRMRWKKSQLEVECIAKADELNAKALEECFRSLKEGDTEIDASIKVARYMVENGAYRPPYVQIIVNSGPEWRAGFLAPKNKQLRRGDLIFIDSGCVISGYWGEFNRMASVGPADERQSRNHRLILEIVRSTIQKHIHPGSRCSDVMRGFFGEYEKRGLPGSQYKMYSDYPFMHLGHGIGLHSSEPPFIRLDNDQVLEPGMVFSIEAYLKDIEVYGTEEDIVVTEDGSRIISPTDPGLYTIASS